MSLGIILNFPPKIEIIKRLHYSLNPLVDSLVDLYIVSQISQMTIMSILHIHSSYRVEDTFSYYMKENLSCCYF